MNLEKNILRIRNKKLTLLSKSKFFRYFPYSSCNFLHIFTTHHRSRLVSACIWFPQYMKKLEVESLKANEHFEEKLLPKGEGKSEEPKVAEIEKEESSKEAVEDSKKKEEPNDKKPESDDKTTDSESESSSDDQEDEPENPEDEVDEPKKDK